MALRLKSRPRYRRRVGAFSGLDVKHDESVINFSTAKTCYNFDFSSGALRDGYGIQSDVDVPKEATAFWIYRYYSEDAGRYVEQYLYQYAGVLRYYDEYTGKLRFINGNPFPPITAINYRLNSKDVLLMSCEGHRLISWNGKNLVEYATSPVISSMALHYERLFVTSPEESTKVYFSQNLDPTNWNLSSTEGGFIELLDDRGALNKVVSFANYLYIFRDHGISRVTAYGDQSDFSVTNLFVSAGRIYPESIVKCGACIVFLASDGLYVFDGYECVRALKNLDGLIVGGAKASAYHNGKYYLSCRMDFGDGKEIGCESGEFEANALLVFDPSSGEYSLSRGLDIRFLGACSYLKRDFLAAYEKSAGGGTVVQNGAVLDNPLPKMWKSGTTDFSAPDKTKALRELYVTSATDCTVCVDTGKKQKTLSVKAGSRRLRLNTNCKEFSLEIACGQSGVNIRPPTVIYSTY